MKTLKKSIFLLATIFCLVGLSGCSLGSAPEVSAVETNKEKKNKEVDQSEELEKTILILVNQYRFRFGLPPLEVNAEISEIARNHSSNMAKGLSIWGHEGYNERIQMVATLIRWEEIGENLARNSFVNPAQTAMNGWINSPLHENNLIGDFTLTGIGIYRSPTGEYFFTQIFVRG